MPTANCTRNCWIAGIVLGLLVWVFTAGVGSLRWFEGLFLGLVAAGLMGQFLIWFLCGGSRAVGGDEWQPFPATAQPGQTATAAAFSDKVASGPEDEHSQRIEHRDGAAEPQGETSTAIRRLTEQESGVVEKADMAGEPANPAIKDELAQDDLKEIRGVGPKLEDLLRVHGVTRFAQIAEWDDAEIDHFAGVIGRMGSRIRSDDWVGQARILAAGGETQFSKRVEKGDIY